METKLEYCTIEYPFEPSTMIGKRVLSTSLFLGRSSVEDLVTRYLKPLLINIHLLRSYPDIVFLIYMDRYTVQLQKQPGYELLDKLFDNAVDNVKIVIYDCLRFKYDDLHHYGLFGTLTRIFPAFTLPIEAMIVIDADTVLLPLQMMIIETWLNSNTCLLMVYQKMYKAPGILSSTNLALLEHFMNITDTEYMFPDYVGSLFGFMGIRKNFIQDRVCDTRYSIRMTYDFDAVNDMFSTNPELRQIMDIPRDDETILPIGLYNHFMDLISRNTPFCDAFYQRLQRDDLYKTPHYEKCFQYGMDEYILNNIITMYIFSSPEYRSVFSHYTVNYSLFLSRFKHLNNRMEKVLGNTDKASTIPLVIYDSEIGITLNEVYQTLYTDVIRTVEQLPRKNQTIELSKSISNAIQALAEIDIDIPEVEEWELFNNITSHYEDPGIPAQQIGDTGLIISDLLNYYFWNRVFVSTVGFHDDMLISTLLFDPDHFSAIDDLDPSVKLRDRTIWSVLNSQSMYHIGPSELFGFPREECRTLWTTFHTLSILLSLSYTTDEDKIMIKDRVITRPLFLYIQGCLQACYGEKVNVVERVLYDMLRIQVAVIVHTIILPYNIQFPKNPPDLPIEKFERWLNILLREFSHHTPNCIDMDEGVFGMHKLDKLI